jgi:hypothetical protein
MKTYRLGPSSAAEYRMIREQNLCDVMTESSRLRFKKTPHFRYPKKGEWYLSGCNEQGEPEAYVAPIDLSTRFHIAEPVGITVVSMVETLEPLRRDQK